MANSLTVTGGGMQGAFVSTAFATPVTILVKDASNIPQAGVTVISAVPGIGASCTTAASAVTNGSGVASFTLTANSTAGQYVVSFGSSGANSAASLFRNSTPVSTSQTKTPALATQETQSSSTATWTNPGFLSSTTAGNYAQCPLVGSAAPQILKGSQFGFTLPDGAVVDGYKFDFYAWRSSGSDAIGSFAVIYSSVTFNSTRNKSYFPLPGSRSALSLGGSSDLWSASALTATQVNSDLFTVGFTTDANDGNTIRTNGWTATVYYSNTPTLPVADTAAALNFCAN